MLNLRSCISELGESMVCDTLLLSSKGVEKAEVKRIKTVKGMPDRLCCIMISNLEGACSSIHETGSKYNNPRKLYL